MAARFCHSPAVRALRRKRAAAPPWRAAIAAGRRSRLRPGGARFRQFNDPPSTAFFGPGDARLCDDASAQPRRGPGLAARDGNGAGRGLSDLVEPPGAGAALWQLSGPLHSGAVGPVGAAHVAAASRRADPGGARLRDPDPARPSRRRDSNFRRFFRRQHRLLHFHLVGLFRSLARAGCAADGDPSGRLDACDVRPAFLAAGQTVVCAGASRCRGRCHAGAGPVGARRDRSRKAGRRARGRSGLDPRRLRPYAVAGASGRATNSI